MENNSASQTTANSSVPSCIGLMNIDEVSKYLKVSKYTIYGWISKGLIKRIKLGRLVRFDRKDIDDWILRHKNR